MIARALPVAILMVGSCVLADPPARVEPVFRELSLGEIKPTGWLKSQLEIQAKGLGGHLDEFWPDIKDSAWIGGKSEGWERTPYWLDGIIPLAFQLDDPALKAKAKRFVDYILDHQADDGWLGPVGDNNPKHKPYDVWPLFVLFKALTQWEEATGDPRVVPAMLRACKKIDEVITKEPLYSWAHYRGADLLVSLHWLHAKTGEKSLLELADKVAKQSYDWRAHFEDFEKHREKATKFTLDNHGVNNGMGLKFGGMRFLRSGDPKDRIAVINMLDKLDAYHGQASGIFSCDEHYAGRSPSQGSELCTVAEAMYSLELLQGITGDPRLGDRLEKLAFNALPATFSKDMTGHQYDQQANQVVCKVSNPHVYTNNGPDSNLFGREPNFGCCTANFHQAWPKLVSHLWAKSSDGGLACMVLAPCHVETTIDGKRVKVDVTTYYPFSERVLIEITVPEKMNLPIHVRIPGWAKGAKAFEDYSVTATPGKYFVGPKIWAAGKHHIPLVLPMSVSLREGYNGAVSIERGPLVYALKIGAEWKKLRGTEPYADFEVHPATPWNYALEIDRQAPSKSITFQAKTLGDRPFSQDNAPVSLHVKGRRLVGWGLEKNAAAPPPPSPVTSDEPLETLTLIPYGATDLRVTEFPTLKP